MNEVRVFQLGTDDFSKKYRLAEGVSYHCFPKLEEKPKESYDVFILQCEPTDEEIDILSQIVGTYTLYVMESVSLGTKFVRLYAQKKGKRLKYSELETFLACESRFFFPASYGEKYKFNNLAISKDFNGDVTFNGNVNVTLSGDFGKEYHQIAFFRNNIPLFKNQVIDLWLEYRKDPSISIEMEVLQFRTGTVGDIRQRWIFSEADMEDIVRIDSGTQDGLIFVSIRAKGTGKLQIIALHDRYSRGNHGHFLPGGQRYVTKQREEVFYYFDPADMMPPLNVYFSGYKTKEGFEGLKMLKKLGCPFLLISESRLEGGNFYMGSKEYENAIVNIITSYMKELGFSSKDVTMSGLSMGTYGALYYGCDIKPHALILGKPLASIGDVATNEKYIRPGGFPTSLDVLLYQCGTADLQSAEKLNERFWIKFDLADFSQTKFIISYMIEDDYDANGYTNLLSHLSSSGVQVYGKGIHGRHNDNTNAIINWFIGQFKNILSNDYTRRTW